MDELNAAAACRVTANRPLLEVFRTFLRLGLTSFGGPIAHIGYFRQEFVVRRRWMDEGAFADLAALCQFLPGPASSQLGFALGLSRAAPWGGIAAWAGFTFPSAILLFFAASLLPHLTGTNAAAAIHGLEIVAVAVVGQAVWGMARTLTPDPRRAMIAVVAGIIVFVIASAFGQIAAIVFGGLAGLAVCRNLRPTQNSALAISLSRRAAYTCLAVFLALLVFPPLLPGLTDSHAIAVFDAFYRTGALVFGGGHVVLPLLQDAVVKPGWISANLFLTGYGAAQAVPGPLFTVAAFLGAVLKGPPNGMIGATIALTGIFLPGLLLVTGALPFWDGLRTKRDAQAAMRGVNAAVVGILAVALYDPLWKSAIGNGYDAALALAGFTLLVLGKSPSWLIVIGITAVTLGFRYFGP